MSLDFPGPSVDGSTPIKALIADDDPVFREVLRVFLERQGLEVVECVDGSGVLGRMFAGELPQLVFLDLMMPHISGLDVCREIRGRPHLPYTYVIMITGQADRESVVFSLRNGVNDYVVKPIDFAELESRLQVGLQMIRLNNLVEEQRFRLANAAKMATLGQMAAGVAHEINNPLAILSAHLERLTKDLDPFSSTAMKKSVDRIAKIVKSLSAFAGEDDGTPFSELTLPAIIEETLLFCSAKARKAGVEIRLAPQGSPEPFLGQKMRLCQVVLSLVENSLGAVSGRTDSWILIESYEDKSAVHIAVSDNGVGIPKEIRDQILHPFVGTKGVAARGLGLSVSRGIIALHGGQLRLDESSPYTRFVLSLPKRLRHTG